LQLSPDVKIMTRTRYSFWDALGDVGGFHDGLVLLVRFFMAPYSAALFFADFLKNGKFATRASSKVKHDRSNFARFL